MCVCFFLLDLLNSRVVNEPLESISMDLGFSGNTLAEGGFLSTCDCVICVTDIT